MNIDAISAVSDAAVLPGQIGSDESFDVGDGAEQIDFKAVVQQLNAVIDPVVDCVVQPDDTTTPEINNGYEQASLATYLSGSPVNLISSNADPHSWPDASPTTTALDQWQPETTEVTRELPTVVRATLDGARSVTPMNLDAKPSAEILPAEDETSLSVPLGRAILPAELSLPPGMNSVEKPTVALVNAVSNGPLFTDGHPSSTPLLSSSTASASPMTSSLLPEMLIAGGQHHVRAVAQLPNLGTVQVEMTRASASEVAVHVYAGELSVAALERCSSTLQQLVATAVQPAASEAAIKEVSCAPGSESGIKIALSLTSQNQSQADGDECQQQGRAELSRPVVEQLTIPARVTPVTALVDLLI